MPSEITYKDILLYKTEPCRNWNERGVCRYAKRCRYAHGAEELRPVTRSNQYKTKTCKAYHESGTCPYGVRCTFIHRPIDDKQPALNRIVPSKESVNYSEAHISAVKKETLGSSTNTNCTQAIGSDLNVNDIWGCKVGFTSASCYQPQNYRPQKALDFIAIREENGTFSNQLQFLRRPCNSPLYDISYKSFDLPK